MYQVLLYAHSYARYFVLITLVYAIYTAANGLIGKREFGKADKMAALFALIFAHTQFLGGLLIYFVSPVVKAFLDNPKAGMKIAQLRFWGMEHISTMLIAVIIITVGYSIAKRKTEGSKKFQNILIYYAIGLFLILITIPWAGINARPWFRM